MGFALIGKLRSFAVQDALSKEREAPKEKDSRRESNIVPSTMSEDKQLERNRGGESWNRKESGDKTPRCESGAILQIVRSKRVQKMLVFALMVVIPVKVAIYSNQSQRVTTQALELSKHQNNMKTLFETNTNLNLEKWKNGNPYPIFYTHRLRGRTSN